MFQAEGFLMGVGDIGIEVLEGCVMRHLRNEGCWKAAPCGIREMLRIPRMVAIAT